jgi:HTH-type transcriptional regulator/antitoxin HigA
MDARFVRRDASGHFKERSDVSRVFRERGDGSSSLLSSTGHGARAKRDTPAGRAAPSASGGTSGAKPKRARIEADYLALVRRFPLRPIRGPRDYDAAADMLDRLVTKDENGLTAGERDYLDTLTLLVERYDDEHYQMPLAQKTPAETLKYLMEQSGMGVADLGRVIGSQPAASMVLHGRRELSKSQIRKLADHFKVEPGLLLSRMLRRGATPLVVSRLLSQPSATPNYSGRAGGGCRTLPLYPGLCPCLRRIPAKPTGPAARRRLHAGSGTTAMATPLRLFCRI